MAMVVRKNPKGPYGADIFVFLASGWCGSGSFTQFVSLTAFFTKEMSKFIIGPAYGNVLTDGMSRNVPHFG